MRCLSLFWQIWGAWAFSDRYERLHECKDISFANQVPVQVQIQHCIGTRRPLQVKREIQLLFLSDLHDIHKLNIRQFADSNLLIYHSLILFAINYPTIAHFTYSQIPLTVHSSIMPTCYFFIQPSSSFLIFAYIKISSIANVCKYCKSMCTLSNALVRDIFCAPRPVPSIIFSRGTN